MIYQFRVEPRHAIGAERDSFYNCPIARALIELCEILDWTWTAPVVDERELIINGRKYKTDSKIAARVIAYDNGGEPADFIIEIDDEALTAREVGNDATL